MKIIMPIFIITLLCACNDTVSLDYATYVEAREDKLFQRGWLPDILPTSTTNISVNNNLDLNTSTGHFNLRPADAPGFIKKLSKLSTNVYSYQGSDAGEMWVFEVYESGDVTYKLKH